MKSKMILSLARLRRGMQQRSSVRMLALSITLMALVAAGLLLSLPGSQAQSGAQSPDYSKVNDALGGATHILRNDDLVVGLTYLQDGDRSKLRGALFATGTKDSTPDNLVYAAQVIPAQPNVCGDRNGCNYDYYSYYREAGPDSNSGDPITGRFFNTQQDSIVQYPFQSVNTVPPVLISLTAKTGSTVTGFAWQSTQNVDFFGGGKIFLSAVDDFNADGLDDLVMGYGPPTAPRLRIATAANTENPAAGFKFSPELILNANTMLHRITSGDFDGDGQPEIAVIYYSNDFLNFYVGTYRVDPGTLQISGGGQVTVLKRDTGDNGFFLAEFTAGRFNAAPSQQLIVATQSGWFGGVTLTSLDFAVNSINPSIITTWDSGMTNAAVLRLKAGRLNWSNPFDQLVLLHTGFINGNAPSETSRLSVLQVNPTSLAITRSKADVNKITDDGSFPLATDIAIGNFDHKKPNEGDPSQTERNPDLEIAVIGGRVNRDHTGDYPGTAFLHIYEVPRDLSALTRKSSTVYAQVSFGNNPIERLSLQAADLQGRSFRLGTVSQVTVSRQQASVVLAAPPMHVDYALQAKENQVVPTVVNLSLAPENFHSEYEYSTSKESASTNKDTTSMTFSGEEKASASLTLGKTNANTGELEDGVKISDTFTATQDIENSTETVTGSFQSEELKVSLETELSDSVWFKDTSYYLYVYPVIGRKICPADKPNCQESEKTPLRVIFSAPKDATIQRLAADTIEWYQPPWEYGNLFSYPAGLAQLKLYVPDIALLTKENDVFGTDNNSTVLETTWAKGSSSEQSTEHKETFGYDDDLSIEGAYSGKIFGIGAQGNFGLDLNFGGSDGKQSLQVSETELKVSSGITTTKTATFADPVAYKYFFAPYIFGVSQPDGFADDTTSTADQSSFGPLRSAFTVDMLGSSSVLAGGWWRQTYTQYPDVAINHPNRWANSKLQVPNSGVIPTNCLAASGRTDLQCATPTERAPENPMLDAFHDMRGLFITNADNKPSSNPYATRGAQQQNATEGDKMLLQTRVYNYSLKAMPSGSKVKVRFYGMEWNPTTSYPSDASGFDPVTNKPSYPGGKSFLIGETAINPIPAFNTDPGALLNWTMATTIFDTTGRANKDFLFWVAVWIEDASGKLVQETPNHGLKSIPPGATTVTFREMAELEEMVANPLKQSATDPDTVSFSNNIGLYRAIFQVLPKTSATTTAAIGAAEVKVESVTLSGTRIKSGQSVEIAATLRGGAQELTDVMVNFYDGDPQAGGKLFDIERIGRLRAGGQHKVSIRFRPQVCGAHNIFVRVAPERAHEAIGRATQAVQLDCPTPVCVAQVCMRSPQYYALNLKGLPQGMVTILGGGLNNQVSTGDTKRLRLLLQGGASRQQQLNQQFVATQLSLLAQAGGQHTVLQSNLLCYKLSFQPTQLSTGATLNPSMTLGELFAQVRQAGHSGNAIDQRLLTNLLELLNGNDPQGRCR